MDDEICRKANCKFLDVPDRTCIPETCEVLQEHFDKTTKPTFVLYALSHTRMPIREEK